MRGWRQFSDSDPRDRTDKRVKRLIPSAKFEAFTPFTPFALESKNQNALVAEWLERILSCSTTSEYFAVMRDFRATNPTEDDIAQIYRFAALKLAVIEGGGTYIQEEIERRLSERPGQSPETVATAPLSLQQARALKRKYEATGDLWDRFWFWIGKQIERGADAEFIEKSEAALTQACNEPDQ